MQLPLSADVLPALGVGALVSVLALVLVLRRVRRSRTRARRAAAAPAPEDTRAAVVAEAPGRTAPPPPAPGPGRHDAATAPPGVPPARPGPDRTVAAAVAEVLAQRAAAARNGGAASPSAVPRGDARDRLLAVLLDDPVRAVGAVVELEACKGQLQRLTEAMRHERGVLAELVGRLARAGLQPEQLSRLADLPVDEVRALLTPEPTRAR